MTEGFSVLRSRFLLLPTAQLSPLQVSLLPLPREPWSLILRLGLVVPWDELV